MPRAVAAFSFRPAGAEVPLARWRLSLTSIAPDREFLYNPAVLDRRTFIRTSALVIGAALLLKLLGLVEKLVLAERFGVGKAADAALIGATGALLLGYLLYDVVTSALVPVLVGGEPARQARTTGTLATLTLLLLLAAAGLGWWQARSVVLLLAPGFDAETQVLALQVFRAGLVGLPALGLAAVLSAHLNANGHYLQPALADLMLKLGPVLGLVWIGGIEGLSLGLAAGALLRVLFLLRPGLTPLPTWRPADPGVRRVLDLAWPLLGTAIISIQLFAAIEAAIASTVGVGVASALSYARRIADVPIFLVPQVAARVALPTLAELATDRARLRKALGRSLELTLVVLLPPTLLGMLLAEPVVRLIYGRGAFDQTAVAATATALWALLPGMPALGTSVIVQRFAYALKDTRGPSLLRLGGLVLHIVLAIALRSWGIAGIAWASTLTLWAEALGLVLLVAWRVGGWRGALAVAWRRCSWLAAGSLPMLIVAVQLDAMIPAGHGLLVLAGRLALISAAAVAAYAGSLALLRLRHRAARGS